MDNKTYRFVVEAEDSASSGSGAAALADMLREVGGVLESERNKAESDSMDLGSVVTVIATSGATLALARGLAAWLQARRGVTVTIDYVDGPQSLRTEVTHLDPEAALRVFELIRGRRG